MDMFEKFRAIDLVFEPSVLRSNRSDMEKWIAIDPKGHISKSISADDLPVFPLVSNSLEMNGTRMQELAIENQGSLKWYFELSTHRGEVFALEAGEDCANPLGITLLEYFLIRGFDKWSSSSKATSDMEGGLRDPAKLVSVAGEFVHGSIIPDEHVLRFICDQGIVELTRFPEGDVEWIVHPVPFSGKSRHEFEDWFLDIVEGDWVSW